MKETDLDKVKTMAKVFLEIEIGKTEMSPAIVQHPFTNSGFYPCRLDDGNLRIIDITTSQGFDEWKKIMRERIDSITSIGGLFLYVNKPYSMTLLKGKSSEINEAEAEIVRKIFKWYLRGKKVRTKTKARFSKKNFKCKAKLT